MEIKRFIDAVFRNIWLIVLLSVIGALGSGAYSIYRTIPLYSSETSLYIINGSRSSITGEPFNYQDMALSKQLVLDYSEIIRSRRVLEPVIRELGFDNVSVNFIKGFVDVGLQKESNVMTISAVWYDPETARDIANSVSKNFMLKIRELTGTNNIGILDEALVARAPLSSSTNKNILVGFAAGLMLAIAIIYVLQLFDTTIRMTEDIEVGMGLKVIGIIPEHDIK